MDCPHIVIISQDMHLEHQIAQVCPDMLVSRVADTVTACALVTMATPVPVSVMLIDGTSVSDLSTGIEPVHVLAHLRLAVPHVPLLPITDHTNVVSLATLLGWGVPQHPVLVPEQVRQRIVELLQTQPPDLSEAAHALCRVLSTTVSIAEQRRQQETCSVTVAVLAASPHQQMVLTETMQSTGTRVQIATTYPALLVHSCHMQSPDVIVCDARRYRQDAPVMVSSVPILGVATTLSEAYALQSQVAGVVLDRTSAQYWVEALIALARAESYVDPLVQCPPLPACLTPAEQQVARMLLQFPAATDAQLAQQCGCTLKTVGHHRRRICDKLSLTTPYELCMYVEACLTPA